MPVSGSVFLGFKDEEYRILSTLARSLYTLWFMACWSQTALNGLWHRSGEDFPRTRKQAPPC